MSFSKEGRSSGFAVLVGFSAMCAILLALVVWQPKAATWIAQAVDAEAPNAQGDVTASIAKKNPPMRKPIQSTAWAQIIDQGEMPPKLIRDEKR